MQPLRRLNGELIGTGPSVAAICMAHKTALQSAQLQGAQLQGVRLQGAQLQGASLQGANLHGATLDGAQLQKAWLQSAQLQVAWLQDAQLQGAWLQGADLQGARLQGAQLQGAWLQGALLQGAQLQGVSLQGAFLPTGESFEDYLALVVPALCQAGGQPLHVVAAQWGSHEWPANPMGTAFQVQALADVPLLHYPRVVQFLQLYEAGLVPRPVEA